MPFSRMINLVLSLVLLCVFTGTLAGRLVSLASFVERQMASHAQDTATSLALSLGPAFTAGDHATVKAMAQAIFDRGSYREITVFTMEGRPVIVLRAPLELRGFPGWLPGLADIETPTGDAVVMDGWRQAAQVTVAAHPLHAYRELWDNGRQLAQWFAGAWCASTVLLMLVTGWLLKPLRDMERQALAVAEQRFPEPLPLPRTQELRSVAAALNLMTERTREAFARQAAALEIWRDHAFRDKLTGLENRASIEDRLHRLSGNDEAAEGGALILVKLEGLGPYNRAHGREAGDAVFQGVAGCLQGLAGGTGETAHHGRMEGATFAAILPGADEVLARRHAGTIVQAIALHLAGLGVPDSLRPCAGVALFRGQSAEHWLTEADGALQEALASGAPVVTCTSSPTAGSPPPPCPGGPDCAAWLGRALGERTVSLLFQPVIGATGDTLLHHEVYARFPDAGGNHHRPGAVLPMLLGLGKTGELDRMVAEKVLQMVAEDSRLRGGRFAVNLSPASLMNSAWLADMTASLAHTGLFGSLFFEVAEAALLADPETIGRALLELRSAGAGIGVDRFGVGPGRFGYLMSLRPDYVKIDGGFLLRLREHEENRFYVQSLAGIARSLGITVIACGLEHPEDIEIVRKLAVDGLHGNAVAPARECAGA